MSQQQHTVGNALCKGNGHDWQHTLSQTYRICKRSGCRAAQRLKRGTWIAASSAHGHSTRLTHSQQQHPNTTTRSLWSLPVTTSAPVDLFLDIDPREERRLERQYYKAIADEHYYRATHARRGGEPPCR